MLRLAAIYLLITLVLICPYMCLGQAVRGTVAACETNVCCCDESKESASDESPQSPDDRDEDCFCQGAIFDVSRATDPLISSPVMYGLVDVALCPVNPILAAVSFESPHPFPPFSTGRDVCMLTCTLQL